MRHRKERLYTIQRCMIQVPMLICYCIYASVSGRNKIQHPWQPTMFIVTEVSTEDGGPCIVTEYGGVGNLKKVNRAELQLCPVGDKTTTQPNQPKAATSTGIQTIHRDSTSTDTESEFLLLVNTPLVFQKAYEEEDERRGPLITHDPKEPPFSQKGRKSQHRYCGDEQTVMKDSPDELYGETQEPRRFL